VSDFLDFANDKINGQTGCIIAFAADHNCYEEVTNVLVTRYEEANNKLRTCYEEVTRKLFPLNLLFTPLSFAIQFTTHLTSFMLHNVILT